MTADIDDGRYNTRNGVESSQKIASANMYVDVLPWDNNSTPINMNASDGVFDSVVEAVEATIDTSELAPGRHIVYVVGTDADGNEGVFSAVCLEVIVGTCSTIQDFETASAGEGETDGWSTNGSTCSTGTFEVGTPAQMIDGNTGVMTQLGGDHTTGSGQALYSASNTNVGGNDIDDGECVATSPIYSVTENSILSVWYFHGQRTTGDDPNGDYFRLEMSVDGGASWTSLVSIGDVSTRAIWTEATSDVFAGSNVRLRIRASDGVGDGDIVEAGIDDIVICPLGPPGPPTTSVPTEEVRFDAFITIFHILPILHNVFL